MRVGLGCRSEGKLDFELAALHVVAQFQARHDQLQEPWLVCPRLPRRRVTPFTDRQEVKGVRHIDDKPSTLETLVGLLSPLQERRPAICEGSFLTVLEVQIRSAEA